MRMRMRRRRRMMMMVMVMHFLKAVHDDLPPCLRTGRCGP